MKKPVVISNVPVINDYVLDNKIGIIVLIGDVDKFRPAVLKLTSNKNYAEVLGKNFYIYTKDRGNTNK